MSTVTLIDGRQVDSASEEWRHECECRAIADIRTLEERRAVLEYLEKKRGPEAVARIKETMKALWGARKGQA